MKTKHLFFATALVASFAACTNEEIVDMQQSLSTADRAAVEGVKLNFVSEGVDSRLTFGSNGYAWEATDTIGALQMDTYDASKSTWHEMYPLTSYVNTSYPFVYNTEDGTWACQGKMLEGNYFFAFPWSSYDGGRKVVHSLLNQEQNGVKGAVVAENYAKNQLFIGYAQIKKGAGFDVLTDVEMTPVLGAIQLRLVNKSSKELHINKIQLSSSANLIDSELTFDPTTATYTGYSYNNGFNYANYVGDDESTIYMATGVEDYEREIAIRKVVKATANDKNVVILNVNGASEERAIAVSATGYALVMTNEIAGEQTFTCTIITDEGKISKSFTVAEGVGSDISNTVVLNIEDNEITGTETADIYVEDDLAQLINWNINAKTDKALTAALKADVELNKEVIDLLKSNAKLSLTINGTNALTLAEDFPAGALEYKNLTIANTVPVKVAGTLTLTKDTKNLKSIEVLEDATLNINETNANVPATVTVDEKGTLNIGAGVTISNKVTITNNGTATIAATATVQKEFNNNGTLTLNGKVSTLKNTGIVTMGEGAKISSGTNKGTAKEPAYIYTAANSEVSVAQEDKTGRVKYAATADITATGSGYVFAEVGTATIDEDTYDETGVNLYILTGGTVTISESLSMNSLVEVAEGAVVTLKVAEPAEGADAIALTMTELTVKKEANLTTEGVIIVGTITVEEDAEWSNEVDATVSVSAKIDNKGNVYNSGVVKGTAEALDGVNDTATLVGVSYSTITSEKWNKNPFTVYGGKTAAEKKAEAMKETVEMWAKSWTYSDYYDNNPYNVNKYIALMKQWYTNNKDQAISGVAGTRTYGDMIGNVMTLFGITGEGENTWEEKLTGTDDKTPVTEFTTAVDNMLNEVLSVFNAAAFNATTGALNIAAPTADPWIAESQSSVLYATRALAFDNFAKIASEKLYTDATFAGKLTTELNKTANAAVNTKWGSYKMVITAAIYKTADATIETALKATKNTSAENDYMYYSYVWAEATNVCPIYKVMQVLKDYKKSEWCDLIKSVVGKDITIGLSDGDGQVTKMEDVKILLKYANLYGSTGDMLGTLKDMNYFPACNDWTYLDNEVKAAALKEATIK